MRYRSKPTTVEAVQWQRTTDADYPYFHNNAEAIVAWVNANGGEAHYPLHTALPSGVTDRIAVRTINGWAYAAPGHYVVMGDVRFPAPDAVNVITRELRDFYPCDPGTFERRWEVAP